MELDQNTKTQQFSDTQEQSVKNAPNFDVEQRNGRVARSKSEAGANPFEAFNASSGVNAATKPDSFSSLNAKADHFKSVGLR